MAHKYTPQEASDMLDVELVPMGTFETVRFLGYIIGFLTSRHPDSVVDAIRARREREGRS